MGISGSSSPHVQPLAMAFLKALIGYRVHLPGNGGIEILQEHFQVAEDSPKLLFAILARRGAPAFFRGLLQHISQFRTRSWLRRPCSSATRSGGGFALAVSSGFEEAALYRFVASVEW